MREQFNCSESPFDSDGSPILTNEDSEDIVRTKYLEHIDDGVFVGNKDHILEIFPQYLSYSKEWGGVPKASKFIIYFHSLDAFHIAVSSGFIQNMKSIIGFEPNIKIGQSGIEGFRVEDQGFRLLGTPIGSNDFKKDFYLKLINEKIPDRGVLENMSAQARLLVIRLCVASRFGFSLSTEDSWGGLFVDGVSIPSIMDKMIMGEGGLLQKEILGFNNLDWEDLGKREMMDTARKVSCFKFSHGGLNMIDCEDQSKVANIATWSRYFHSDMAKAHGMDKQLFHLPIFQGLKIQLEGLYDQVLSSVNFQMNNSSDEIECDMSKYYTGLQKSIKAGVLFPVNMEQFVQQRYSHKQIFGAVQYMNRALWLRDSSNLDLIAKNKVFTNEESNAPFRVVPTMPCLTVPDFYFTPAIRDYLLVKCPTWDGLKDKYNSTAAKQSFHELHNVLKKTVKIMAIDTNVAVADLEPAFLDPNARDRADIKITELQKSTDFYVDVTVARPDSASFIAYSKQKPGLVAQRIEKKKLSDTHYARHAKSEGLKFYPMGVEDSGAFGDGFKKVLKILYRERKADPSYQKGPRLMHRATGKKLFGEHSFDSSIENWSTPTFLKYWISRIQILLLKHRIGYKVRTLRTASISATNRAFRDWERNIQSQEYLRVQRSMSAEEDIFRPHTSMSVSEPRQVKKGKISLTMGSLQSEEGDTTAEEDEILNSTIE
ncbi:MAG: hypothetical protein VXY75_02800 [Bacteroidota bacterium]|nr:hypothetical protein [Bacteroidota bacterium]